METPFPSPHDDDAEDVAWGLTTGAALWKQGERYDAIVWLKRAVEAANDAGAAVRADELNRAATGLIALLAAPPSPPRNAAPSAPKIARAPSSGSLPAATPAGPGRAPNAPSPPPFKRAAPAPPKPPPPARSKLPPVQKPPGFDASQELTPVRATLPSVTTSAPTIDKLTHPEGEAHAGEERRDAPPPPTIVVPNVPASAPTPRVPATEAAGEIPAGNTPAPAPASDANVGVAPADAMVEPAIASFVQPVVASSFEPATAAVETPRGRIADASPAIDRVAEASSLPASPLASALERILDLTASQRRALFETATIESLASEEDITVGGLALVVDGQAAAQATVADVSAVTMQRGELLYAKSSIPETLSLRLVAEADPTTIAIWDAKTIEEALAEAPAFVERLRRDSDRTQAIAGCTMGPVGERLDEGLRGLAIAQLEVRVLQPNEVIATAGQPVPGMVIVGVGTVELDDTNGECDKLGPGDFLFATEVLAGGGAPSTARAGSRGAIVLFGGRAVAHELLVTCPPLLEVFAGM